MRVLIIGGGSHLQPGLRRMSPTVSTVVLCRASVLGWVHKLEENEAVVVLNDECPLQSWLDAARAMHAQLGIDAIASLAEIDQDKAAAIAADLGLPFHSPETVARAHDKYVMRTRLAATGVEDLPFRQVADLAELESFYAEVGPPLLLKPTSGRASAGIAVVHTAEDLAPAFARTSGARAPRLAPSLPLAERFVEGPEFSVETISDQGVHYVFAITEKFKDEATKVEIGHAVPARIPDATADRIIAHVRNCLTALEIDFGITHTEVILGSDGPVLVETHLRQAGDEIVQLVESATGIDMTEVFLAQIAGQDVAATPALSSRLERPHYTGAAAIRYVVSRDRGTLDRIDGLEAARRLDGVTDVSQLIEDGSAVDGLLSSYSRLASVRVQAPDPDAAIELALAASAELSVVLTAP